MERVKEIPVEVEKVVYSEKIIPQEVVIDVPKVGFKGLGFRRWALFCRPSRRLPVPCERGCRLQEEENGGEGLIKDLKRKAN